MASYCDDPPFGSVADWTAFHRRHPGCPFWPELDREDDEDEDEDDDDPHTVIV